MKPRSFRTTQAGFTLIEVLIAVLLVAILAIFGFPALQNMIVRSKIEGMARNTATLMQLARLDAIRRSTPAVVWFRINEEEIVAFSDTDGNGNFDPGERLLGRHFLPTGVSFSAPDGEAVVDGFVNDRVIFFPNGSVDNQGAVRFGDVRDNYLETRVEPAATARVEIRKWETGGEGDSPGWYAAGEGAEKGTTKWKWN